VSALQAGHIPRPRLAAPLHDQLCQILVRLGGLPDVEPAPIGADLRGRHVRMSVAQGRPYGCGVCHGLDGQFDAQLLRERAYQAVFEALGPMCAEVVAGRCIEHDHAQFTARADILQRRLRGCAAREQQRDCGRSAHAACHFATQL
jgi:hypothetical protein